MKHDINLHLSFTQFLSLCPLFKISRHHKKTVCFFENIRPNPAKAGHLCWVHYSKLEWGGNLCRKLCSSFTSIITQQSTKVSVSFNVHYQFIQILILNNHQCTACLACSSFASDNSSASIKLAIQSSGTRPAFTYRNASLYFMLIRP